MLLIALVALGSATFAWFVDDPNVTATGLTMKANTALGLVAQTTTDGWGSSTWKHDPALGKNLGASVLVPVTPVKPTTGSIQWFNAAGEGYDDGDLDTTTGKLWALKTAGTAGELVTGGIYYEQIKFKLEGGQTEAALKLTGCTVTGSNDAIAAGVTVAFVYGDNIIAMFNKGTADSTTSKWTGLSNGAQTAAPASGSTWDIHKSGSLGTPITIDTFTADAANNGASAVTEITLDIYVFLDGANANVKSSNATVDTIISSIVPTFTAVA
jgi:hypothetical protein